MPRDFYFYNLYTLKSRNSEYEHPTFIVYKREFYRFISEPREYLHSYSDKAILEIQLQTDMKRGHVLSKAYGMTIENIDRAYIPDAIKILHKLKNIYYGSEARQIVKAFRKAKIKRYIQEPVTRSDGYQSMYYIPRYFKGKMQLFLELKKLQEK